MIRTGGWYSEDVPMRAIAALVFIFLAARPCPAALPAGDFENLGAGITGILERAREGASHMADEVAPVPAGRYMYVDSEVADLRSGPDEGLQTQLIRGEAVKIVLVRNGWAQVAAAEQPTLQDPEGYPGWVRLAELSADSALAIHLTPLDHLALTHQQQMELREAFLERAKVLLGKPYLWGGRSERDGVDCSGLVSLAFARAGYSVLRNASDLYKVAAPVRDESSARPGDLVFFRNPQGVIHHVVIYSAPGQMLEAPGAGDHVRRVSARDRILAAERSGETVSFGTLLPD